MWAVLGFPSSPNKVQFQLNLIITVSTLEGCFPICSDHHCGLMCYWIFLLEYICHPLSAMYSQSALLCPDLWIQELIYRTRWNFFLNSWKVCRSFPIFILLKHYKVIDMGNITYHFINGVKSANTRPLLAKVTCAKKTKYTLIFINERARNHRQVLS